MPNYEVDVALLVARFEGVLMLLLSVNVDKYKLSSQKYVNNLNIVTTNHFHCTPCKSLINCLTASFNSSIGLSVSLTAVLSV